MSSNSNNLDKRIAAIKTVIHDRQSNTPAAISPESRLSEPTGTQAAISPAVTGALHATQFSPFSCLVR